MKSINNFQNITDSTHTNPSIKLIKLSTNYIGLAIALVFSVLSVSQVHAEATKALQEPVTKPADGKGKLPTFDQADVNGDHYLTKNELQNFPYMLQVFDKIDAGKDGKLEQHEYQNLKMETKREGEVR